MQPPRRCHACGKEKPATTENFYRRGDGWREVCKPCQWQYNCEYYIRNRVRLIEKQGAYYREHYEQQSLWAKMRYQSVKQRVRDKHLRELYGISLSEYDTIAKRQDGRCALCGAIPSGRGAYACLCVDHDHETGRVRALLCARCNKALGHFCDDINLLKKAIEYLKVHTTKELKEHA